MFIGLRRRILAYPLLLALSLLLPIAQALELGAISLAHVPANPMSSVTFSRAPAAFSAFARAVGGVAFTGTAVSTDGTTISRLKYDATAPDGSRISAEVRMANGSFQTVAVEAYDWILLPLARLVATDATGAVTLFGSLQERELQQKLQREKRAMIANYHPALENTLLGLRLLQADMIAFEANATDLFKEKGQYILGAGETAPSDAELKANLSSFKKLSQWTERQSVSHTSYITGDVDSKILFSVQGGKLVVTGEPTWYCWRTDDEKTEAAISETARSLSPDAFGLLMLSRIEDRETIELRRLQRRALSSVDASKSATNIALMAQAENETLLAIGKLILSRLSASPSPANRSALFNRQALTDAVASGAGSNLEPVFSAAVKRFEALEATNPAQFGKLESEIKGIGSKLRDEIESVPVVQMRKYSAEFSKVIASERGVNPTVYKTLRRSIQIAGILRAAKQSDAESFQKFVQSMRQVPLRVTQPPGYRVTTPTVYPRA
jgi:hypothetical protein